MALSVALAFGDQEEQLAGRPFKFVVDLRWPDEMSDTDDGGEGEQCGLQRLDRDDTSRTGKQRAEFEV